MANDIKKPDSTWAKSVLERDPPKITVVESEKGVQTSKLSGGCQTLMEACRYVTVAGDLATQVTNVGAEGQRTSEATSNFILGFVDAMDPQDPAEVLLLTQMAATHKATMMLARRLNHVGNIPHQDAAERAMNKLARTFTAQMETLKRYRSKGQQVVRVERVTVQEGGQAIVGNVEHRGERDGKR